MNKVRVFGILLKALPLIPLVISVLYSGIDYNWGWGRCVRYV